jgi:DnaJ-class molecular chaperone
VEFQGYYALLGCAQDGRAVDLYLAISVRPDARFERSGDDLRTRVQAPLATPLLGGEARVPTPDGRRLALTIPPATQDGESSDCAARACRTWASPTGEATCTPKFTRGCLNT